jgi:tetratricopeptide (TPR) repeat protein
VLSKIKNIFNKKPPDLSLTDKFWELLQNEKYEEVITEAKKLVGHKSAPIAKDVNKLLGMALFKQAKYKEALPYFQKATEYSPEITDWFNVITSGTLSKNIEVGRNAFDKAVQMQLDAGHRGQPSIPFMRQYYACALRDIGEYDLALEQINELRQIYEQLQITDTTFVYIRGVPFLSHTMDVAVDVFNGLGASFDAQEWIDNFSSKLDAEGQEFLNEVKAKIQS